MTDLILRLAEVVPADQRARVLALTPLDDRTYQATVEELIEVQRARLPWADVTLEYLVSVKSDVSAATRAEVLRVVLRRLQRAWDEQGRPTAVMALDLSVLTRNEEIYLTAMGHVVEEALWANQAPVHLIHDVCHVLPGRFIRSLGWANLSSFLPSPVLTLLVERSGAAAGKLPAHYLPIARLLHSYRAQPYIKHLAFAAATLMGDLREGAEHNQPSSIRDLLYGTANVLSATFSLYGLAQVSDFEPDKHLMAYARSKTIRPLQATRVGYSEKYLLCADAQRRWCRAHSAPPQVYLDWHFSDVNDTHAAELGRLRLSCTRERKKRRQKQVETLEPQLLTILRTALTRDEVICGVNEAYAEALAMFRVQPVQGPVTFSYRLRDEAATLWFALWTPNLLSNAEQVLVARPDSSHGKMRNSVVTEYLGATDREGHELPLPFFAEFQRAWYDPKARQAMIDSGIPASDVDARQSTLLKPDQALGSYIDRYTAEKLRRGQAPRILLDLTALYTGVTYAVFLLVFGLVTGMRINELQQLRADPQGSWRDADGRLNCRVRAKGEKGITGEDTIHIIDAQLIPYWTRVLEAHEQRWEYFEQVIPQFGDLSELSAGLYLLQGNGKALTCQHLAALLRFLISGVTTETVQFSFVLHFLRYLYSRTRGAIGDEESAIKDGLGHHSMRQAREYFLGFVSAGSSARSRSQAILQPPRQQTCWEALLFVSRSKP